MTSRDPYVQRDLLDDQRVRRRTRPLSPWVLALPLAIGAVLWAFWRSVRPL